jgi:5-methyltetrahydropteroyltriglutamate--homocysteine methyltransferase
VNDSALPILPTTVIGSYSFPDWLGQVRKLGKEKSLNTDQLQEAHDNAVKSAIKDQELAGVDVITDGELRRETMVNFFSARIHGFDMTGKMKPIGNLDPSIQMRDPVVKEKVRRKESQTERWPGDGSAFPLSERACGTPNQGLRDGAANAGQAGNKRVLSL